MKVRFKLSHEATFGDLKVGDTFSIPGEEGLQVYMKIPPHTAKDGSNVTLCLVQLTGDCAGTTYRLENFETVVPRKFELVEV